MFAPKVAKPLTKATDSATSKLLSQRLPHLGHRPGHQPVELVRFFQHTPRRQATPRLLAQRESSLTGNENFRQNEQDAEPASLTARGTTPGVSWDFSKIAVSPERVSRLPLAATPSPNPIQAKLVVGQVNDPLEHEADRAAEQVMRMPGPEVSAPAPRLSRKCAARDEEEKLQRKSAGSQSAAIKARRIAQEVLRSPGQPLDASSRAYFEPRFGHDFSKVRIHADGQAAASARALNALAYTAGQHVVFEAGAYGHGTAAARRLLAHELAHTIQQSSHPVVTAEGGAALQRAPAGEKEPALPELQSEDPALSPRYIDTLFESVSPPSLLNGATTFYWKEGAAEKKITIPLKDFEQDDTLTFAALWKLHKSKDEALKTVELNAKAAPGFAYYSFYTGQDGVIMPTSFSIGSTPLFHKLWPDLKRLRAESAADISQGLRQLANTVNPFPCTEVDEQGNLTASINFGNCALPILLHAHAIHSSRRAAGAPARAPEHPADPQTQPHQEPGGKAEPAVKETAGSTPEIDSFARNNNIEPGQLASEVAELNKNAGDPAKVHGPADPRSPYDAEMRTLDGHDFHRDKETRLWERCSPPPCKKGLKVAPQVNQKVDATLSASKSKLDPAAFKQERRDLIAERAKLAEQKRRETQGAPAETQGQGAQPVPKPASLGGAQTAKDVITADAAPLSPGRSGLGQYGIDRYGSYSNRPQDKFAGHELLQNLWLEVKGFGKRLASPASRDNPAIALTQAEHTEVGRQQRAMGLFDRDNLAHMSAEQVIEANAQAMRRAGVPDFVIETLRQTALRYAATLKVQAGGTQ